MEPHFDLELWMCVATLEAGTLLVSRSQECVSVHTAIEQAETETCAAAHADLAPDAKDAPEAADEEVICAAASP